MSSGKKRWMCINCGWIYDEQVGYPPSQIAPGTAWEDIPEDWKCPDCLTGKSEFDLVEID